MNIVSGFVLFVIIWWTVLFAVLPFGVRTADQPEAGHATSAPVAPMIGRKMLITTAISIVLWAIIAGLIIADLPWLDIRAMALNSGRNF